MSTRSDPGSLDELALGTSADIRLPLLRTLVDLYVQKPTHTTEETQHFNELVLRLLDQADDETRIAVTRRLASCASVPSAVMRRLAVDRADAVPDLSEASERATSALGIDHAKQERARPAELSDLFFTASSTERRLILDNLIYASGSDAVAISGNAQEAGRQLETAALAHNADAFTRALAASLGLTPALARRILRDPLGEPIVVAGKAIGIAPDALQRILLFINPAVGRSVARVYELAALFETIDAKAACAMVAIWRNADREAASAPMQSGAVERGTLRASEGQARRAAEASRPADGKRYSTI